MTAQARMAAYREAQAAGQRALDEAAAVGRELTNDERLLHAKAAMHAYGNLTSRQQLQLMREAF